MSFLKAPTRVDEGGFLLLEAVLITALVAIAAGTALAVVASMLHAAARSESTAALDTIARNVLADLRAATAYDPVELDALADRSIQFSPAETGASPSLPAVVVTVHVAHSQATTYIATITAQAGPNAATIGATLTYEAPAPGTIVPPGAIPSAGAGADTIAL